MNFMNDYSIIIIVLLTIFVTGCGGGNDKNNEINIQQLTSKVESTLVIEDQHTNQWFIPSSIQAIDSVNIPYSVESQISHSLNYRTIEFNSTINNSAFKIQVMYGLYSNQPLGISITFDQTQFECVFIVDYAAIGGLCSGINISIDPNMKFTEIDFKSVQLFNLNKNKVINLNGKIRGEFSQNPLNVHNIPVFSKGILKFNGQPVPFSIVKTEQSNDYYKYSVGLPSLFNVILSPIIYFDKNDESSMFVVDPLLLLCTLDGSKIVNAESVKVVENNNSTQFLFNQTRYQFPDTGIGYCNNKYKNIILDGDISVPVVNDQYSLTAFKSINNESSQHNSRSIFMRLNNINRKYFGDGNLSVDLIGQKIKNITFNSHLKMNTEQNDSLQLDYVYTCKNICNGVKVDQDGYGVEFKNTQLFLNHPHADLKNEIIVNGKFRFYGF